MLISGSLVKTGLRPAGFQVLSSRWRSNHGEATAHEHTFNHSLLVFCVRGSEVPDRRGRQVAVRTSTTNDLARFGASRIRQSLVHRTGGNRGHHVSLPVVRRVEECPVFHDQAENLLICVVESLPMKPAFKLIRGKGRV